MTETHTHTSMVERLVGLSLARLPTPVAAALARYRAETDPSRCIRHASDAVEGLLRLLVLVGLGEVQARGRDLPDGLLEGLGAGPPMSMGGWYRLAWRVARHMRPDTSVPGIPRLLDGALGPLLVGAGTREDSLLELARHLGGEGGLTPVETTRLWSLHAPRFEEVMRAAAGWLEQLELVMTNPVGRADVLAGPDPRGLPVFRPTRPVVEERVAASGRAGDALVLVRGEALLPLWPLGGQAQRLISADETGEVTIGGFLRLTDAPPPVAVRHVLPDLRMSVTHHFYIGGHEGRITVSLLENDRPGEIAIEMGKTGGTINGLMSAFAAVFSLGLKHGVPLDDLVQPLADTRFEPAGFTRNPRIVYARSPMAYLASWLMIQFPDGRFVGTTAGGPDDIVLLDTTCPECGWPMERTGRGPLRCWNCGATKGVE